jgi:hypothetical protein
MEWKQVTIEKYSNYEVSSGGDVRNKTTGQVLKQGITQRGYHRISFGHKGQETVHRLIALAFLPNPDNLPEVDHIDRNQINNNIDNLRWVTSSENNINRKSSKGEDRNITWCEKFKTYQVHIKRNKKYIFSKCYKTLEEARVARDNFLSTL